MKTRIKVVVTQKVEISFGEAFGKYALNQPRWFPYVGENVRVYKLTTNVVGDKRVETHLEIETSRGKGLVVEWAQGAPEVIGWIGHDGGRALFTGVWTEYHGANWLRAYGFNPSGRKVDRTCPARVYHAMQGLPW